MNQKKKGPGLPIVTVRTGRLMWEARLGSWTARGITPGLARLALRLKYGLS